MIEQKKYYPLKLVKNVVYPSYQLWATVANTKTPLETSMTIAILTVMAWLRERFREFDIPPELIFPEPSKYAGIQLSDFPPLHINEGYSVDIVSIPDEKVWALQLLEPDLGPDPGNPNQTRKPVPGRIFETNIGFRINSENLECGFQTMVADPNGCKVPCEVFRLAVVKELVRNPLLGLRQKLRIQETVHKLETISSMKSLKEYLKDDCCGLPVVIFTEYCPTRMGFNSTKTLQQITDELQHMRPPQTNQYLNFMEPISPAAYAEQHNPVMPYDIDLLVKYKMGYAHFFTLPYGQIANFNKIFGSKLSAGDIGLFEPDMFGGGAKIWNYSDHQPDREALIDRLEVLLQNYPMKKPVMFGNVLFAKQAKLLNYRNAIKANKSVEDILQKAEEREAMIEQSWKDMLRKADEKIELLEAKTARLQEEGLVHHTQISRLSSEHKAIQAGYEKQLKEKDRLLDFYMSLTDRPERTEFIPDWVEERFQGRMILHQRAQDLISKTPTSEVDMKLLCNALEFLATEYRDEMEGLITEEEMLNQCSKKYNRPFDVSPVGSSTIEFTPNEYKVKYYIGYNGKPVESALDLHLRVGNDAENLLRIYFLYDKDKRLVVIGSLPKHLRNIQIK